MESHRPEEEEEMEAYVEFICRNSENELGSRISGRERVNVIRGRRSQKANRARNLMGLLYIEEAGKRKWDILFYPGESVIDVLARYGDTRQRDRDGRVFFIHVGRTTHLH